MDDPENFRLNVATYVLSWGRARRVTVLLRNAGLMESAQEMGKGEKEENTFLSLWICSFPGNVCSSYLQTDAEIIQSLSIGNNGTFLYVIHH